MLSFNYNMFINPMNLNQNSNLGLFSVLSNKPVPNFNGDSSVNISKPPALERTNPFDKIDFSIKMRDISTCDGVIDDFEQGGTGDCWLLSGLNSLSKTPKGQEIIKNSIVKNKDNSITVNLKGIGISYTITNAEFRKAQLEKINFGKPIDSDEPEVKPKYSSGDSDALLFELAIGKFRQDIAKGSIDTLSMPVYAKMIINKEHPIEGGISAQVYYLLSGKTPAFVTMKDSVIPNEQKEVMLDNNGDKMEELLDKYTLNPQAYALGFCSDRTSVKDVTGKNVHFSSGHEYAIEGAKGDSLIITDPHNTKEKIILNRSEFLKLNPSISYLNLDNDNDEFDNSTKKYLVAYVKTNDFICSHY